MQQCVLTGKTGGKTTEKLSYISLSFDFLKKAPRPLYKPQSEMSEIKQAHRGLKGAFTEVSNLSCIFI